MKVATVYTHSTFASLKTKTPEKNSVKSLLAQNLRGVQPYGKHAELWDKMERHTRR